MSDKIKDTQVIELIGRNRLGSEILRDGLEPTHVLQTCKLLI